MSMLKSLFPLSEKIAAKISSSIETWLTDKSRIIVGIDGYSASRKSTVADCLATINSHIVVVHLDDLLRSSEERVKMMNSAQDRSKVFELKWYRYDVLEDIVNKWKTGARSYKVRVYDFDLKKTVTKVYDLSKPVLLIEGIFLFHPKHAVSRAFDKKVYLFVDFDQADQRRARREKKRFGAEYVSEDHPDSFAKPFTIAYRRYYKTYHPDQVSDLVMKV